MITVREGDNLFILAQKFSIKNKLPEKSQNMVYELLQGRLSKIKTDRNF